MRRRYCEVGVYTCGISRECCEGGEGGKRYQRGGVSGSKPWYKPPMPRGRRGWEKILYPPPFISREESLERGPTPLFFYSPFPSPIPRGRGTQGDGFLLTDWPQVIRGRPGGKRFYILPPRQNPTLLTNCFPKNKSASEKTPEMSPRPPEVKAKFCPPATLLPKTLNITALINITLKTIHA